MSIAELCGLLTQRLRHNKHQINATLIGRPALGVLACVGLFGLWMLLLPSAITAGSIVTIANCAGLIVLPDGLLAKRQRARARE